MANNKTFVKISNQQIYDRLESLDKKNDETHDEIKIQIERCRVVINDHLHEHQIIEKEMKERKKKEKWIWGIIVAIVGIVVGFVGSLLL